MAENFDELESTIGVPAPLLERAAEARATADGKSEEAVVAEWTGEEAPAAAESPAVDATALAPAADTAGLPAVESLAGDALIAAAAEAKGIPVSLVERSAQARADADGVPVDAVMREWVVEAGLATAGAVAIVEVAPAEPTAPTEPAAPAEPAPPPEAVAPAAGTVEVLEPAEPIDEAPEEEAAAERTGRYPAWLAAALVIIPLFAVLYVVVVPNQPSCGSAGQVGVDPATGVHANCDGSVPYGAVVESNVRLGSVIYAASCAVCHGDAGQGAAGPALAGGAVLATFPEGTCDSHIEWVTLGSIGWPDDTYGATNKPVQGGMPPAALTLTEEEIAQVALYERVVHGGEDEVAAEGECGFNEEGEFEPEVVASG